MTRRAHDAPGKPGRYTAIGSVNDFVWAIINPKSSI
jgi:hypothetical protein